MFPAAGYSPTPNPGMAPSTELPRKMFPVPYPVVHRVRLEPVGEFARVARFRRHPRARRFPDTELSSISQLLPLASTAESALFCPEVPVRRNALRAQRPRVGTLLQVGALGR